jgi:hypothetical protein
MGMRPINGYAARMGCDRMSMQQDGRGER